MTKEKQIKALAKLDGKSRIIGTDLDYKIPRYTESYDAIIPLWKKSFNSLKPLGIQQSQLNATSSLLKTPAQLSEALLRALGLWEE